MKKLAKTLFLTLAATAATSVFAADYASKLVKFSTTGDKYADGSAVLEGEFYALCWSADEAFDGIKADLTPVNAEEEVIYVASLAKDGGCPPVIFVVDGAKYDKGNFFVFLLDTRESEDKLSGSTADGKPVAVNGTLAANTVAAKQGGIGEFGVDTGDKAFSAEGIVAEGQEAYIKAIDPVTKSITVANVNPVVKYNIKWGKTIDDLKTTTETLGETLGNFDGEVTFFFTDKEDARFFTFQK